jgi:geranylgeranyl diphosphate synthase type II
MDDDTMRRGIPTNHVVFGEACAVLTGDALLTKAFSILTDQSRWNTPPETLLSVAHIIAEASGEGGMLGGQISDIESERADIDIASLEFIHIRKTGALILASVRSGAILGGGTDKEITALSEYGKHLGLAFQISDDILDVIGDTAVMGKEAGKDHVRGKATYPTLLGLSESKRRVKEAVERAVGSLAIFNETAHALRAIGHYIVERKG